MQEVSSPLGKLRNIVLFLTAVLIVTADQLSKVWIRTNLALGVPLFEIGPFRIIRIPPNSGAAFGLFQGQTFALSIVALVAVVIILVYALFLSRRFPLLNNTPSWVALGLILGGTTGNLIDRLNPNLNGVTDFISIGSWWPIFNIADAATTIGTITLACFLLCLIRTENQ